MKILKPNLYRPQDLEKLDHEELTYIYYQENALDKEYFDLLHSRLTQSKPKPQTQPTLEQRIQMIEERIDELETINTL